MLISVCFLDIAIFREYFLFMEGLSVKKGKFQLWESASALCHLCKAIDMICSECRDFCQEHLGLALSPLIYLGQNFPAVPFAATPPDVNNAMRVRIFGGTYR